MFKFLEEVLRMLPNATYYKRQGYEVAPPFRRNPFSLQAHLHAVRCPQAFVRHSFGAPNFTAWGTYPLPLGALRGNGLER